MRIRLAALLTLPAFLLAGCFEDPISETLVIQMLEEEKAAVTATVTMIGTPEENRDRSPLLARLQGLERDYLMGNDPWTRRFERVQFEHEERTLFRDRADDSQGGHSGAVDLRKVRHMVVIPREELGLVLNDSGVAVHLRNAAGTSELTIVPGAGSLASTEQRRALKTHLEQWAGSAVIYIEQTRKLYAYLAANPERATACFAGVFEDLIDDDSVADPQAYALLDGEKDLVKSVHEAMKTMAEDLTDDSIGEVPYGLNELSYLVYDPLPAAVTVCIPKEPEEVEGFITRGDLCYAIPRRGIVEAFEALDGRWVTPDPFATWIRIHRSEGQEKLDLEGFAAKRRSAGGAPSARQILEALEGGMRHQTSYRLRWIETLDR